MAKKKKRTTYGYEYWGGGTLGTTLNKTLEFVKNNPEVKEELIGLPEKITGLADAIGSLSDNNISAEQAINLPSNMYGLGGLSTALTEATNDINLAKGLDTSTYESKVRRFGNQGIAASDNQELLQALSNRNRLNNVSKYDITGGNLAKDIIGGVGSLAGSVINGAMTGGVPMAIATGAANLIGQGIGIFNTGKNIARLNNAIDVANSRQDRAISDAINNIRNKEKAAAMVNFAAFGGPLYGYDAFGGGAIGYNLAMDNLASKQSTKEGDAVGYIPSTEYAKGGKIHIKPSKRGTFTAAAKKHGKSVQAFASQVLANKENYSPAMVKKANFARNAAKWHADGGMLLSDNFTNGVNFIGNGGTHEQNPHQGVPMGIAPDGKPNLVEEGEVIYNDYVFSNRLRVPKEVRNKYKLRGPKDMTFAEAFEYAQKESSERENDPISENGLDNIAMILARTQEAVRGYQKAKGHEAAEGRHLFLGGSDWDLNNLFGNSSYAAANLTGYLPYDRKMSRADVAALEQTQNFQDWTNYVLDNWDDEGVQAYLRELDRRGGNNKLFDANGNPVAGARDYFQRARTTGPMGYYHWTPNRRVISAISEPTAELNVNGNLRAPIELLNDPRIGGIIDPEEDAAIAQFWRNNLGDQAEDPNARLAFIEGAPGNQPDREDLGTGNSRINPLRLAEPFANAAAVFSDLMGKTNTPTQYDYIPAFQPISYQPLGDYIAPEFFDTRYAANQAAQQAAATREAIMQSSAPSRYANLLAADYNAQVANGQLLRDAAMQDYDMMAKRKAFNRGTNQYNSETGLKTAIANQDARLKYAHAALQQARLNDEASTLASAARAQNLGNLAESIANIGRELDARDWKDMLLNAGVFGTLSQKPDDWSDKKWNAYRDALNTVANGGKIRKKKKGLTY